MAQVKTDVASDDDAVMARVAARDALAFRLLIDAHASRAHRVAWRMLADGVEAEDVAQEAMLRLWSHAASWRAGGPGVGAWVTRVAMNLCLDRLRRRKFHSDEDVPERIDESEAADDMIDSDRIRAMTVSAVQALPERQRAAIILTYYEEQPNIMAAATLDMNIKAFESLLLRARAALRSALGPAREAAR
ncbi:MAG: sigma-70 family RNA polymerase sigma factor [Sphingomonadaceae bacterium]